LLSLPGGCQLVTNFDYYHEMALRCGIAALRRAKIPWDSQLELCCRDFLLFNLTLAL